ncbi:MAG: tetratricopeptide repeat protein [Chitinophagaceae bacterium]
MNNLDPIPQEEWELIEQYLSGNLSAGQHYAFEARMNSDPSLQAKVQQVQTIAVGIKESALEQKLQQFHQQLPKRINTPVRKNHSRVYWLSAAAAVALLIVAGLFISRSKSDGEKLFAHYFEADPGLATTMGSSTGYEFNLGMIQYRSGKFKEAVAVWTPLLKERPLNDTLNYFTGLAFLSLEQADSAVHFLKQTLSLSNTSFQSDANWFLALSLLKQDKTAEAISFLQQTKHPRKEEILAAIK